MNERASESMPQPADRGPDEPTRREHVPVEPTGGRRAIAHAAPSATPAPG